MHCREWQQPKHLRVQQCGKNSKNCNSVLKELMIRYRAYKKLDNLYAEQDSLPAAEFQLLFNRWDGKVIDHKRASESQCNKFMDGKIKFSPVVGLWISRLQTYRWMLKFKEGEVEPWNLFRVCTQYDMPQPRTLDKDEVSTRVLICTKRLENLKSWLLNYAANTYGAGWMMQ